LEDGTGLVAQIGVPVIHLVKKGFEDLHVFGVRDEPVDGGEVLPLREFFV